MVALVSFLLVLTLSIIVERVATVALILTGLSRDMARFQARSAFTGSGFTTSEAEAMMSHPARRRIVMLLMGMRNVEIITGVSTLVLSFIGVDSSREGALHGLLIVAGLVALGVAASNKWVDHHLSKVIAWALHRWTSLDARDYTSLLGLTNGYAVLETVVDANSWMVHRKLEELNLPEEGVTVLAIQRKGGAFVGAPARATVIRPGDKLILYGQTKPLAEISQRQAGAGGDQAHRDAIAAHQEILREQDQGEHAWTLRWLPPHERRKQSLIP
jgi:hypothetical protein